MTIDGRRPPLSTLATPTWSSWTIGRPGWGRGGASPFPEDPRRDAVAARILWLPAFDPGIVTVDALPVTDGRDDALALGGFDARVIRFVGPDGEHLLLKRGLRALGLAVRSGTFASGQARLRYAIEGLADLPHKLLSLRRLVALRRLGRFPVGLFPVERRAHRWLHLLRVLDALAEDASYLEIARALFAREIARDGWRGRSDYLRLRVQRLARLARQVAARGHLAQLGGPPPL
jgi:hypothetical protein